MPALSHASPRSPACRSQTFLELGYMFNCGDTSEGGERKSVTDVLYPAPFPPPPSKRLHGQSQDMMSAMGGAGPTQESGNEFISSQQPVSLDRVSIGCPMSAHAAKYPIYHPSLLLPTVG